MLYSLLKSQMAFGFLIVASCSERGQPEGFGSYCDTGQSCGSDLVCYLGSPGWDNHCTVQCDRDSDCRFDDGESYYCARAYGGTPAVCVQGVGEH